MIRVGFYNTTTLDKTEEEFVNNPNYKAAGALTKINDKDYLEIVKKVIPNKLDFTIPFYDEALTREETQSLLNEFDVYITNFLANREKGITRQGQILFKGRNVKYFRSEIEVRRIIRTYNLLEECLKENKPVYLSITEEEE
jgi:hypothetical protein